MVGISNKDYNDLKNLTTKDLNTYINQITGAAVGASEEKRLKGVVPTIDSPESVFESNLSQFNNFANADLESAIKNYGFSDIASAKQAL